MNRAEKMDVSGWIQQRIVQPFAIAGAFVLVALLWTLLLQQIVLYPLVFLFFAAVMGSAWFGGAIAAFWSVVQSSLAIEYFFISPTFSIQINKASKSFFTLYVVSAAAVGIVTTMKQRTEAAIRKSQNELEQRVAERTAELEASYREIQRREQELRKLTEAIPQQLWSADPAGNVQYCNQQLLDLVGRREAEILGERFPEIFAAADRNLFVEAWQKAILSGQTFEGEWRIHCAPQGLRWFLVRALPQRSEDGAILRWYGTLIDIDEREQINQELTRTQAEFARLSRVQSLGELTVSIAHEVNQPLTAIVAHGYACLGWLKGETPNLEKARHTAEKIIDEGTRAGAVVHRMRALFGHAAGRRELAAMNVVIREAVRLVRDDAARRGMQIHLTLAEDLPQTTMDSIQIQQVLLNLIGNGLDAMAEVSGERRLNLASSLNARGEIEVCVEDNGVGIALADREHIFDSFFSTKGSGVGVGLSISRTIIEAHEGKIWAEAREHGGSRLRFTIPVNHE